MALRMLQQIRDAISNLNPAEVRTAAERPVLVGLTASSNAAYEQIERYLLPPDVQGHRRLLAEGSMIRSTESSNHQQFSLEIVEEGLPRAPQAFSFDVKNPEQTICDVLDQHEDLGLALARRFPPFRDVVVARIIKSVARENAIFSLATALPDIVPLLSIPLSAGEFASDTAFLTMNQIRMAFLIAAANGQHIGYREQKTEVASMIAGAFGWRAICRELVGKIPFGGGLIPKAGIAYAGTYAVGLSLERFYRLGRGFTDAESRAAYTKALDKGKAIAGAVLEGIRKKS